MATNITVHKQTLQTYKQLTIKETHRTIHKLHNDFIVTNKNKGVTKHITTIRIFINDR
jgi:hypothetical protein